MYKLLNKLFTIICKLGVPVLASQVCIVFLFGGCVTYHFSSGEKFRNWWFPAKDDTIFSEDTIKKHTFNEELFFEHDTSNVSVQFVFPEDIKKIANKLEKKLLVMFYMPNCSGAGKDMQVVKYAESHSIPVILISHIYSPQKMSELYRQYQMSNRICYIIPTVKKKTNKILQKVSQFIHELYPDSSEINKDDFITTTLITIDQQGNMSLDRQAKKYYSNQEFLIHWIDEQYGIAK